MEILDGKATAEKIKQAIRKQVDAMIEKGERSPHLAAILVGNDGASETYVGSKVKTCAEVGFDSTLVRFDATATEAELLSKIDELNNDDGIDGYIVQLPLPKHISEKKVMEAVSPKKDVDGFHAVNVGKIMLQEPTFVSATPKGIMMLLEAYKIETSGKHCVVIGRSNIVGSPMSVLMSRKAYPGNCTVTLCHSATKDLKHFTLQADIIIAALGKAEFLKADMVKEGAIVIDVGITRLPSDKTKSGFRLVGDVDYKNVAPKCSYITPVPGGVGPMTIMGLLQNTLLARTGFGN